MTAETSLTAFDPVITSRAVPVELAADQVLDLSGAQRVVLIEQGAIDVFAAPTGRVRWTPLCRLPAGSVVVLNPRIGSGGRLDRLPADDGPWPDDDQVPGGDGTVGGAAAVRVFARPVPGSVVSTVAADLFDGVARADRLLGDPVAALAAAGQLVQGIDRALSALESALRQSLPPREFIPLEPGEQLDVAAGSVVRSVAGVLWIDTRAPAGELDVAPVCLTELDHLRIGVDSVLRARGTGALLAAGELPKALAAHASRFRRAVQAAVARRIEDEVRLLERQRDQNALSDRLTEQSFDALLAASTTARAAEDFSPSAGAMRVLRLVAGRQGIQIDDTAEPVPTRRSDGEQEQIERTAARSDIPTRTVRLVGHWWDRDNGPLIGYLRRGGRAVALLPAHGGGYLLIERDSSRPTAVDKQLAARLKVGATMLYRPLPLGRLGIRGMAGFGLRGSGRDARRFLATAVTVAMVGLLVPMVTGAVLGSWAPAGRADLVTQGAVLVMASALVVAALTVVQNTAVLRLEGAVDLSLQAGVWARLLALPVTFFGRFAAGELATMGMGITAVRETLSSVSTIAAVGLITAAVNLALLFFYSVRLALIAVGMVLVSGAVTGLLARRGLAAQRELYGCEQRLASRSYQLLSGMSTLRLAAAEARAFGQWSRVLAENLRAGLTVRRAQAAVTVFNAGFSLLCSVALFALVGGPMQAAIGLAAFLAFFTAFNQVLAAVLQFYAAAVAAMAVVPMVEGVRPILDEPVEVTGTSAPPGDLAGGIEVRDVSFRYDEGPLVLDAVSFDVAPGEFVAVVGGTGSGKSTVLRVLLGFETPTTGSVLYDGQDLRQLDIRALRRQCGVVLQNGTLLAGDIATNIIGGSGYSIDDAWRAADLAGIADDIRALPMGMHTVVAEGGSTLSGGQRQRLMIARALIASPRILFFDEATSALDNETQRVVTESTRRLNASRVVIAHRLSTIEHADRIVVLEHGRVAQIGTFSHLESQPDGAFARLIRRQLVAEVT